MLKEERRSKILKEAEENKLVKVLELASKYNVGIETIRRDLDFLERSGKVKKVYGGAEITDTSPEIINYSERLTIEVEEKNEIVEKVIGLINEGDSISINDGSTTLFLAKCIKSHFKKLTVLTNSLDIAQELSDMKDYNIIVAGGILSHEERAFFGAYSESIIGSFIIDKSFIGVTGISLKNGITDLSALEANIQKKLIENSKESYIMVNSSKLEKDSLVKVCSLEKITLLVSDSKINKEMLSLYKNNNITIL